MLYVVMVKIILLVILGTFFILNGVNHVFNTRTYEAYARKRRLIAPLVMVRFSGGALIAGGLSLILGAFGWIPGFLMLAGIAGLGLFLVIASFYMHQFWTESDPELRMMESMHFAKNVAILTELVYIATSFPGLLT